MRVVGLLLASVAVAAGCSSEATASPASLGLVPVPSLGETIATKLADERPVFVVRHQDGQVDVFNARSPRGMSTGLGILLAWCPDRRVFVDRSSGTAFDEFGSRVVGPPPSSMVRLIYGGGAGVDSVNVREGIATGPLQTPGGGDLEPIGPVCQQADSVLTYHEYAPGDAVAPAAAVAAAPSGWVLVEGQLDASLTVMCGSETGCNDGAKVGGLSPAGMPPVGEPPTLFLARVVDGALVDVTVVLRPGSER